MKFTLKLRKLMDRDLNVRAPFLPDDDEYETYLNALDEDISRIECLSRVERSASIFRLETSSSMSVAELKERIRPVFTDSMLAKVRIVSLAEA